MGRDINGDNTFMIRLRSSVILTIITVAAIVIGGCTLWVVTLAVTLIGLMELYRVMGVHKSPAGAVGYLASAGWFVILLLDYLNRTGTISVTVGGDTFDGVFGLLSGGSTASLFALLTVVFLIILLAVYVLSFPKYNSEQITAVFFGFFYVALMLSFIFRIRCMEGGQYSVWLLFIGSWGADTMAYVVGRKLGKHKIVPVLSPKKSLEGFIGGILGASAIGIIYSLIFCSQLEAAGIAHPVPVFAAISAASAIVSMIGDLAASAIKRDKQIKDYGRLIPGHGGILDRFDSVIIVAPIIYYLLLFIL